MHAKIMAIDALVWAKFYVINIRCIFGVCHVVVRTEMFTEANGMRAATHGVSKVLVVLTDGRSSSGYEPYEEAALLHAQGINVFSIGVGQGVELAELQAMASVPTDTHLYMLNSFQDFSSIVDSMSSTTCNEAAAVSVLDRTVGELEGCKKNYFRPTCAHPTMFPIITVGGDGAGSVRTD